jgi:Cu2+-containing amine oxidase
MTIVVRWRETSCMAAATRASEARSRLEVAPLGQLMEIPARQLGDEIVCSDAPGGRLHLVIAGVRPAVGDVVPDGSITEMIVPYGDPGPMHGWKNVFDASECGLGKMANSLAADCDCLGEIRDLDAAMVGERGDVYVIKNAVCIHEEDVGIGWKHSDLAARATALEHEEAAKRLVDPARSRVWKIVNPKVLNAAGDPVAYKLVPGPTPTLLADPASSIGRRAGFATRNLWVTPYEPDERWAAGAYPNQNPGGDGLPRWTAADRNLVETDVVLWHTFGVTPIVRPEEWPVMPVERTGFSLIPVGFFDGNPALDLPPGPGAVTADPGPP